MHFRPLFYSMLGGSYPRDRYIEDELSKICNSDLLGYRDILGYNRDAGPYSSTETRMAALREAILAHGDRAAVVVGRSAGGIVATRLAVEFPELVHAVVVLGYPFKHPQKPDEPERYSHLSALGTRTLIIQGAGDSYGTASRFPHIEFSPSIRYLEIETNHDFSTPQPDWALIGDQISRFVLD